MKKFIGLFLVFLLASCGKPPKTFYYTVDVAVQDKEPAANAPALFVEQVKTEPIYDQDRFVYKTSDYAVHFDHYKRWVNSPALMLSAHTEACLRGSGVFSSVTHSVIHQEKVVQLAATLIDFNEVVNAGKREAVITVFYSLKNYHTHHIIWQDTLNARVNIQSGAADAEAKAMSLAVQDVLEQLVEKMQTLF